MYGQLITCTPFTPVETAIVDSEHVGVTLNPDSLGRFIVCYRTCPHPGTRFPNEVTQDPRTRNAVLAPNPITCPSTLPGFRCKQPL